MLLLKTQCRRQISSQRSVCAMKSLSNWATLLVWLAVVILLYRDPYLIIWWPLKPAEKPKTEVLPLDLRTDSIDDMFDGCRVEAASLVNLFGLFEWHFDRNFSLAWASAEREAKKPAHSGLREEHAAVLHMYTKEERVRQEFNNAVETGKHKYGTHGFKFHYFYFHLTEAVQALRRSQTPCRTTYHRTRQRFKRHAVRRHMRFGVFTLTASAKQSSGFHAGWSCFEIYTCFGADVTYYSAKVDQRGQVLIPPYEVFKINDVLTNDSWCSVVYKLQSTGIPRRDLNCKLNQRQIKTYFGAVSTPRDQSRLMMMLLCLTLLVMISVALLKLRQKAFFLPQCSVPFWC